MRLDELEQRWGGRIGWVAFAASFILLMARPADSGLAWGLGVLALWGTGMPLLWRWLSRRQFEAQHRILVEHQRRKDAARDT